MVFSKCKVAIALLAVGLIDAGYSVAVRAEKVAPAEKAPPADPKQIERLIAQLGSGEFDKREQALKELRAIGDEALPALEKALASNDAEVCRRAETLVDELRTRARDRARDRVVERATKGDIDLFIEYLAARGADANDDDWAAVQKLATLLTEKAGKSSLKYDITHLPLVPLGGPRQPEKGKAIGDVVGCPGMIQGALVARGPVTLDGAAIHSVLFGNGDVTVHSALVECLVISDGDVTVAGEVINSAIVARGTVKFNKAIDSVVVAGGTVKAAEPGINTKIKENDANPLGAVRFFEPMQLGAQVTLADGKLRVDRVTEGTPLAKAGLQKGDVVTALGQTKVDSVEAFRKALRARLVDGRALLKVQRGEQEVELNAKLLE